VDDFQVDVLVVGAGNAAACAALAAREGRLLTLSSFPNLLKGAWKPAAIIYSRGVAAALSAVLCVAGWQFMMSEPGDKILAYGIPYRAFQFFLPLGFASETSGRPAPP